MLRHTVEGASAEASSAAAEPEAKAGAQSAAVDCTAAADGVVAAEGLDAGAAADGEGGHVTPVVCKLLCTLPECSIVTTAYL